MTKFEDDEAEWTGNTARLLRSGRLEDVDTKQLADVLEDMGGSSRAEIRSRLRVLMMHLLKYKFQPTHRTPSWTRTIREQRRRLEDLIEVSPSLKNEVDSNINLQYKKARSDAALETGLPLAMFPDACPFLKKEIMDDDYLP